MFEKLALSVTDDLVMVEPDEDDRYDLFFNTDAGPLVVSVQWFPKNNSFGILQTLVFQEDDSGIRVRCLDEYTDQYLYTKIQAESFRDELREVLRSAKRLAL